MSETTVTPPNEDEVFNKNYEEFIRKYKDIADTFKNQIDACFDELEKSLSAVSPSPPAEDFGKWKRPGWGHTWQQQGLSGLGRRLFRGSNPYNDYITWKMANMPKSESVMPSLHEYIVIEEACKMLVKDSFMMDEALDANSQAALSHFKNKIAKIFIAAMYTFYRLGKEHGMGPEELGNNIPDDVMPKTELPQEVVPTEEPAADPQTNIVNPDDITSQDNAEAEKAIADAEAQKIADEEAARNSAQTDMSPQTEDDVDEDDVNFVNETASGIGMPEELLKKIPVDDARVDEIIQDYEDEQSSPLGDHPPEVRKLIAVKLLANKIMSWVLEQGEVVSNKTQLDTAHEHLIQVNGGYLVKAGISDKEIAKLNATQTFTLIKMVEWLLDPKKFNWMKPNEPALNRMDKASIKPPMDGDAGIAYAALKVRFDSTSKGLFDRLVKLGYKPWLWFKKAAKAHWPKKPEDAEKKALEKEGKKPSWNWPTQLNDESTSAFEAMVDICTAIRCGDLFGHGEREQNPSDTNNKAALSELTNGCYGSVKNSHASIMTALVRTIRLRDKLKDDAETNTHVEGNQAKEAIKQHAEFLHRSMLVREPKSIEEHARRKQMGPRKGHEHYSNLARVAGLEGEEEPQEPQV